MRFGTAGNIAELFGVPRLRLSNEQIHASGQAQHLVGGHDSGEFLMQIRQRQFMNGLRGIMTAVVAMAFMRRGSVRHHRSGITQIVRHAHGCGNAMVGGQADDDHRGHPGLPQPRLKIGADKSVVDLFLNDRLLPLQARHCF